MSWAAALETDIYSVRQTAFPGEEIPFIALRDQRRYRSDRLPIRNTDLC